MKYVYCWNEFQIYNEVKILATKNNYRFKTRITRGNDTRYNAFYRTIITLSFTWKTSFLNKSLEKMPECPLQIATLFFQK